MVSFPKTILCLANSRKISGRCVAGRAIVDGHFAEWVRPVSARPASELSEYERQYENGTDPKVLDVIEIYFVGARPHAFQRENLQIDDTVYWEKIRRAEWPEVQAAVNGQDADLWDNASSSTNGLHDRVLEQDANLAEGSLRLIEVRDLVISVAVEGAEWGNGKRKVRARFSHRNVPYWLTITDPGIERQYLLGIDGQYHVGRAILCISLGEPYLNYAYKLVASVILP